MSLGYLKSMLVKCFLLKVMYKIFESLLKNVTNYSQYFW